MIHHAGKYYRRLIMVKYTYGNIIIDPTSKAAKACVGKEVYYASNPTDCLNYANSNDDVMVGILESIEPENKYISWGT